MWEVQLLLYAVPFPEEERRRPAGWTVRACVEYSVSRSDISESLTSSFVYSWILPATRLVATARLAEQRRQYSATRNAQTSRLWTTRRLLTTPPTGSVAKIYPRDWTAVCVSQTRPHFPLWTCILRMREQCAPGPRGRPGNEASTILTVLWHMIQPFPICTDVYAYGYQQRLTPAQYR